ncbi:MAG: transglutaminase family protein, partial [Nitrospinales bacterium]
MKKSRLSALLFLPLLILLGSTNGYTAFPKAGPFTLERLLSIPSTPEKDIDLAETLLFISKEWDPSLNMEKLRAEIDQLTANVKRKVKPGSTPKEIVNALRQAIHRDGGYMYTEQVDPQGIPLNPAELFIHGLLETKRGYCMNLSLLYLIVG